MRLRIEDRIAAAHICQHQVVLTGGIAQMELVGFTRVAAVGVVVALGEKATEDAVLRVEDREVLVRDHLCRTGGAGGTSASGCATPSDVMGMRGQL